MSTGMDDADQSMRAAALFVMHCYDQNDAAVAHGCFDEGLQYST